MARPRQPQICCSSICRRPIQPDESAVAISCFAQTVGMGKQRTSKSQRYFLCPQCATRITLEKEPSKTAPFDQAIFRILLDLVGAAPDVTAATFQQLHERRSQILYPPALPEAEILPPPKRLKEAS
jgi:hypothetical protein